MTRPYNGNAPPKPPVGRRVKIPHQMHTTRFGIKVHLDQDFDEIWRFNPQYFKPGLEAAAANWYFYHFATDVSYQCLIRDNPRLSFDLVPNPCNLAGNFLMSKVAKLGIQNNSLDMSKINTHTIFKIWMFWKHARWKYHKGFSWMYPKEFWDFSFFPLSKDTDKGSKEFEEGNERDPLFVCKWHIFAFWKAWDWAIVSSGNENGINSVVWLCETFDLILMTFITGNSSLDLVLEGLFAQIHIDVTQRVFGWNRNGDLRITQICWVPRSSPLSYGDRCITEDPSGPPLLYFQLLEQVPLYLSPGVQKGQKTTR